MVSNRIRELRKAKVPKLSQEKLARAAGTSTANVRRLEAGGRPRLSTAQGIAAALESPLEEVFPEQHDEPEEASA